MIAIQWFAAALLILSTLTTVVDGEYSVAKDMKVDKLTLVKAGVNLTDAFAITIKDGDKVDLSKYYPNGSPFALSIVVYLVGGDKKPDEVSYAFERIDGSKEIVDAFDHNVALINQYTRMSYFDTPGHKRVTVMAYSGKKFALQKTFEFDLIMAPGAVAPPPVVVPPPTPPVDICLSPAVKCVRFGGDGILMSRISLKDGICKKKCFLKRKMLQRMAQKWVCGGDCAASM